MLKFEDIIDMISKKKVPSLSKGFWHRFDSELEEKLDAIDSRNLTRFLWPKPVLVAAALIVVMNLALFSLAHRRAPLTSVVFLSNDDLAEELVLTGELASGENIVDF